MKEQRTVRDLLRFTGSSAPLLAELNWRFFSASPLKALANRDLLQQRGITLDFQGQREALEDVLSIPLDKLSFLRRMVLLGD